MRCAGVVLVEGRSLSTTLAHDQRRGLLVALYRRLGRRMKLGAGYSFVDYAADLSDQS